jgi:hypothetical protein
LIDSEKMDAEQVALAVARVPREYWQRGNIGPYFLLQATGYFELHAQVSADILYEVLLREPECVSEWMQYCEDKRTDSGWFIRPEGPDTYVVGFFTRDRAEPGGIHRTKYSDRVKACAAFVKREVEDMRTP